MDAEALLRSCKIRKLCEGQDIASGKDVISQLPDDILLHILSFLPTKDAIRTSVLSSRWRLVWPLMADIYFDDEMIYPDEGGRDVDMETSLFNSVDEVFFRRGSLGLRKFHVSLITPVSVARVHRWVVSAVRLGVQDFSLALPPKIRFVIPDSLFTNKSLHNLEIGMTSLLRVPNTICFPCLKTLSLSYVSFQGTESANRLLSCLPVLESLVLCGCRWRNGDTVSIWIPSLRNLTIEYDSWIFDSVNCCIEVYAANLVSFRCKSRLQFRIRLSKVSPSLVDASLDLHCDVDDHLGPLYAEEILLAVRKVEHLFLTNYTLLSLAPSVLHVPRIPKFRNLTRMEVESAREPRKVNHWIGIALKGILKGSKNLKSLRVDASLCPWEDWLWVKLPECFTNSCLETFRVTDFEGSEAHMKIFTLFLRNCSTLKLLEVELSRSVVSDKHKIGRRVKETLDRIITDRVRKMNNMDTGTIEYPITYCNFQPQILQ